MHEQVQQVLPACLTVLWEPAQMRKVNPMAHLSNLTRLSTNLSTSTHSLHLNRPRLLGLQQMEPARSRPLRLPPLSRSMMYLAPRVLHQIKENKHSPYRLMMRLTLDLSAPSRNCNLLPTSLLRRSRPLPSRCLNYPLHPPLSRCMLLPLDNTRRLQMLHLLCPLLHRPMRPCLYGQHRQIQLISQLRSACKTLHHLSPGHRGVLTSPDQRKRRAHSPSLRRSSIHDFTCLADRKLRRRRIRVGRMVKIVVESTRLTQTCPLVMGWEIRKIPRLPMISA